MRLILATFATLACTPLAAQETRFTRELPAGTRLEIENINGGVRVVQGSGRTAEVVVTKKVKKGNGDLVKAIMETDDGVMRVCTIYLNRQPDRTTCKGNNSSDSRRGDSFEIEMDYQVRLPAGVRLAVETVNGDVTVETIDAAADLATVNGDIAVQSASAGSLETVNGNIRGTFARATWDGTMSVETVNGKVDLAFPAGFAAAISGETVNGSISSPDFPVTISGKWGPKSFRGTVGASGNGGRALRIETVNGDITLRRR